MCKWSLRKLTMSSFRLPKSRARPVPGQGVHQHSTGWSVPRIPLEATEHVVVQLFGVRTGQRLDYPGLGYCLPLHD